MSKYRVVATAETCFGSPRLDGTRLTVSVVVGRFAAGDTIADLSLDYAVPHEAIETMLRSVCAAAYGKQGMFAAVYRRLVEASQ